MSTRDPLMNGDLSSELAEDRAHEEELERLRHRIRELEHAAHRDISRGFEHIANASGDHLSLINREYRYEAVNRAYLSAHGKTQEQILGRTVAEIWGRAAFENEIRPRLDACLAGREIRYEAGFHLPGHEPGDDPARWEVTCYPYREPDGAVSRIVVVSHDVTHRVRTEEALRRAGAELEQRVRQRTAELTRANEHLRRTVEEYERAQTALVAGERRYRTLFETLAHGVVCQDGEGRILDMNPAAERILGVRLSDIRADAARARSWTVTYAAGNPRPEAEHPVLRCLSTSTGTVDESVEIHNPQLGEFRTLSLNVSIQRGPDGAPQAVYSAFEDVTDKRRLDQSLYTVLKEKEAIFKSIPDAVVTVDRDMRVLETNRPLSEICGLARGPWGFSLEAAERRECPCVKVVKQTLETKKAIRGYKARCVADGSQDQTVELSGMPLLDDENRFSGAVLVIRDITRLTTLEQRLHEQRGLGNMVGSSPPMVEVYGLVEQLAGVDSTVLITGESGTGKELVAEALHYEGERAKGPLVKVNCSALSEGLLESELFGHVRGAFSGAVRDKVGRFERAGGGTVFLDEIGDVSPLIQLKLLRFLEYKEFERVGDSRTRRADVRIVAATNADLAEKVRQGEFREDLLYRLRVMSLHMPPLRDRREDIPALAAHFVSQFASAMGKDVTGLDPDLMRRVERHDWPGNVRQLKHALEHACIVCPGGLVTLEHLPADLVAEMDAGVRHSSLAAMAPAGPQNGQRSTQQIEPHAVRRALDEAGGKKARAARILGVSRSTMYRLLRRYGLD